jgi:hypothetical protein
MTDEPAKIPSALGARMQEARRKGDERRKILADGGGPPWAQEAVREGEKAAGEALSVDGARDYLHLLVSDAWGKAERSGTDPDPTALGRKLGHELVEVERFKAEGGVLGRLGWLKSSPYDSLAQSIRAPVLPEVELVRDHSPLEPIAERLAVAEEQNARQAESLEAIVELLRSQASGGRFALWIAGAALLASVVAAVAAIVAL